jgi:G3E family GTPase
MLHLPSPDIGIFGRRQRHVRGHRIAVSIVVGAAQRDRDVAVVVDDFGTDEVLLPEAGCTCCTVRVKLQDALRQRLSERAQQPFGRIAIETLQDIAPILRTFVTEKTLGAEFHVEEHPTLTGRSFTLAEHTPLSWAAFSRFMAALMAMRGAELLHAKGLLNIEGCQGPVAVEFMHHLAQRPIELQAWPTQDRASRLEFITRNIDEQTVRALFDSVRALA